MIAIIIEKSRPETGRLRLSDRDRSDARRREVIKWKLKPGCGVRAITDISKKASPPSDIIWREAPHPVTGTTEWRAVVHEDSDDDAEFNYTISWTVDGVDPDPAHPIKHYDPKIAVKPDKFTFTRVAFVVASVITALFSMILFSKKRNRK